MPQTELERKMRECVVRTSRTSIAQCIGEKLLKVQGVSHCFHGPRVAPTVQECVRPQAGTKVAAPTLCWSEPTAGSDRTLRKTVRVRGPKRKKNIVPMSERIFSVCGVRKTFVGKKICLSTIFNRACGDYLSCRFQMRLHGLNFAKQNLKDMVSRCDVQWPCQDQCAQDFATACPTVRL